MVELLPAQRDTRFVEQRGRLMEKSAGGHDAIVVICEREAAPAVLKQLPFAALLQRSYQRAAARGPVDLLSTRVTTDAIPLLVGFVKHTAAAFERLAFAARIWKELARSAPANVAFTTVGLPQARSEAMLEALVAAALAGSATLPNLKSTPPRPAALAQITLIHAGTLNLQRTLAIHHGNHLARWLTTLPPNVLGSLGYRRALKTLASRHGWQFSFLDEAALGRLGAGAFLAVTRANGHRDAGIVRLRYRARQRKAAPPKLALVGKGICFDTGGINLKSHKSMYQMHEDMQGSAVALGTLLALTELGAPYDIDCWLAITENEIGARAYRPQEVVKAVNGVTIQVVHSDAEGRMVLADTLALAAREEPALMMDFATLTGSCVMALTERYSGAFTNRPDWHAGLIEAGRSSGERVWTFPMDEDFDSDLESSIADILQCTQDSKGDHILAARFLNRFVPATLPWVHVDLAASNRSGGLAHVPTDFTGFGVRFATHLLREHELLLPGRPAGRPAGRLAGAKKRT